MGVGGQERQHCCCGPEDRPHSLRGYCVVAGKPCEVRKPLFADESERRDSSERQGVEESDGGHGIHPMLNWPVAKFRLDEDELESTECSVRIPQSVLSVN